jgi:DNA-binding IclR family transcriptional regulator
VARAVRLLLFVAEGTDGLRHLADVTAETAHLCAWRHGEVVALASFEGSQAVRVSSVHTAAVGR